MIRFVTMVAVLALSASTASGGEFPDSWYFNGAQKVRQLEGKNATELSVKDWIGKPQNVKSLKGKVVVIDFWATWCGPCMQSLPHNVEMVNKYEKQGFVLIGVHDSSRGYERMPAVAKDKKLNYPLAVDSKNASARAYSVSFWPTYVVIDRKGVVRAAGLIPTSVDKVVVKLLAEGEPGAKPGPEPEKPQPNEAQAKPAVTVKPSVGNTDLATRYFEHGPADFPKFKPLLDAAAAPAINARQWVNSQPTTLATLKGKVVVLDFWATWCGPCIKSIPHTNEIHEKYKNDGLVMIGVCHQQGAETMSEVARKHGIKYPVCADSSGDINKTYMVNGYPDYYLIDRSGKLRIVDCSNGKIDKAIAELLAEKP